MVIALLLAVAIAAEFPPSGPSSVTLWYGGVTNDAGQTYIDLETGRVLADRHRLGDADRYSKEPARPKVERHLPDHERRQLRALVRKVLEDGSETPTRCDPNAHDIWSLELHLDGRSRNKSFVFCPTSEARALRSAIYKAENPR